MSLLELKNIKKSYFLGKEEFKVLKGIDLKFERGDFVSLLGESGGGKSTLMNIIGGLDRKYEGDVLVEGTAQKSKKEKDMDAYRRDTIGFIFQSFNLVSYLSVLDNVLVSLKMTDMSERERLARANELVRMVGLAEHKKKKPNQLSGGQKQRVAIARALASDPEVILADEPTGALDSQNTREVLAILRDIAQSGKTVIVVTHSQEVADYGTRVVKLADGQIISDERIKEAYPGKTEKRAFASKPLGYAQTFRMAFQHFTHTWKLNALIAIGTAIGLFAVMFFLGLANGATSYMNRTITSLANPNVQMVYRNVSQVDDKGNVKDADTALTDARKAVSMGNPNSLYTDTLINKLKAVKNVSKVEAGYAYTAGTISYEGQSVNWTQFVNWSATIADSSIVTGTKPTDGEIAVQEKAVAEKFDSKDYKAMIGKTVTVQYIAYGENGPVTVTKDYKISAILKDNAQSPTIIATTPTMKESLAAAGAHTEYTYTSVSVNETKNVKQVVRDIQNLKTEGRADFVTFSLGSILDTITQITGIVGTVLASIAGISLIVSIFMIVVTTYMSVAERTKEIGIIRAMGGRRKDVSRLFTSESLLIGLSSAIIGFLLALLGQVLINAALHHLVGGNIVAITVSSIIFSFIIALLIAFLSSLAPAARAARLNTIEALAAD